MPTHEPTPAGLLEAVHAAAGSTCWSVSYGPSTGSIIQVHLGGKLLRAIPLRNPAATEDERLYESEYVIYVACAWRLDDGDRVVCSSGDAYPHYERMAEGLDGLIGAVMVGSEIRTPALDASLTFDRGTTLHVFCDKPAGEDNYDWSTADTTYGVTSHGELTREPREV